MGRAVAFKAIYCDTFKVQGPSTLHLIYETRNCRKYLSLDETSPNSTTRNETRASPSPKSPSVDNYLISSCTGAIAVVNVTDKVTGQSTFNPATHSEPKDCESQRK